MKKVIGPCWVERGVITADFYKFMLPRKVLLNFKILEREHVFKLDSAVLHKASSLCSYFDRKSDDRRVGNQGCLDWFAESPDSSHVTLFVGTHRKEKYKQNLNHF